MVANQPNPYIDHILKWENRDIVMQRVHRDDLHPPITKHAQHVDPATGGPYFTYRWETGMAPPNVEIEIEIDRFAPTESGLPPCADPPMHNHDFFEILYVYSGQCQSMVSGKEKVLHAGDICLYNLQAIHRMKKFQHGDVVFNILIRRDLFQRSFLDMLAENDMVTDFFIQSIYKIDNRAGQLLFHPSAAFRCEALIQQMIEVYYKNEPMSQSVLKATLILLLCEMTRQYIGTMGQDEAAGNDALDLSQVMAYINERYMDVTLDQLALHFGYTTRSMARYFEKNVASSFKDIVSHLRFHQACIYLRETTRPIKDIAFSIGYAERSSFDRAFKQKYRISPVAYRQLYRGKD